ncbi:hypothetical protein FF38_02369 [Lucilia cuprina]|uniref:Uncharacterized protein n=1 Tax=Lucilia cuprina TaxID=7375 RepID=A0A0L0CAG3_LUCCU|nr:hypothetical protein FF38_02369 [Lucilia cuprina]
MSKPKAVRDLFCESQVKTFKNLSGDSGPPEFLFFDRPLLAYAKIFGPYNIACKDAIVVCYSTHNQTGINDLDLQTISDQMRSVCFTLNCQKRRQLNQTDRQPSKSYNNLQSRIISINNLINSLLDLSRWMNCMFDINIFRKYPTLSRTLGASLPNLNTNKKQKIQKVTFEEQKSAKNVPFINVHNKLRPCSDLS